MSLLSIDQSLSNGFYDYVWATPLLKDFVHFLATYLIYSLPIVLIILFLENKQRLISIKIFLGTILTWKVYSFLIGTFIYSQFNFRDRPFASRGLTELFFEQPQKAFPSDHAAVMMFVTLILFGYRQKVWAWLFLTLMILNSLSRVGIGFHFFGDILGGFVVGGLGYLTLRKCDEFLDRFLVKIKWLQTGGQNVTPNQ